VVDRGAHRRSEPDTGRSACEMPALVPLNRGLLAVNLEVWMLLNTMVALTGENRDLEAGDGNQV
jgi:hypothetical protein